jgi:hypothetical protein
VNSSGANARTWLASHPPVLGTLHRKTSSPSKNTSGNAKSEKMPKPYLQGLRRARAPEHVCGLTIVEECHRHYGHSTLVAEKVGTTGLHSAGLSGLPCFGIVSADGQNIERGRTSDFEVKNEDERATENPGTRVDPRHH